MNGTNVYIRDHRSLIELNNTLGYAADSILKLLDSVKSYLEGVRDVISKQVEYLARELEIAKQKLSEAEDALRSCEASQVWDEEEHEYRPSCRSESHAVERAREAYNECQRKYDEGCRIKDECEREIGMYQHPGGITVPPGGEKTLENIAIAHTKKATQKMQDILEVIEEYVKIPVSPNSSSANLDTAELPNGEKTAEDTPLSEAERESRFKNAIQNVIKKQRDKNYGSGKVADANRAMKCPKCDRPIPACICGMDDRLKYDIQIINNDFSR